MNRYILGKGLVGRKMPQFDFQKRFFNSQSYASIDKRISKVSGKISKLPNNGFQLSCLREFSLHHYLYFSREQLLLSVFIDRGGKKCFPEYVSCFDRSFDAASRQM